MGKYLDENLQIFVDESLEQILEIENELLSIEEKGGNLDETAVNKVYRAAHSIKGGAGFLGFDNIKKLTHEMENVLGKIRNREILPESSVISILLLSSDALGNLIKDIENSNDQDISIYIDKLNLLTNVQESGESISLPDAVVNEENEEPVNEKPAEEPPEEEPAEECKTIVSDENEYASILSNMESDHLQTSLRVNIKLLDSLMILAGEMVLSRNQLVQAISGNDRRALEVSGQRIDLITSQLQEAIMHTRMQPVRYIFDKFPRVVRDLAKQLNKNIDIYIEGKEVELDKSIIENLNDPMTHLIRNAADHGIESPDARIRQGKKPVGKISLRAYHDAGQVNIEISDDGKGMDCEQIARYAVNKGLITEEMAGTMSAREKLNLVFLPGLSTRDNITEMSGRGVGMDVVKTNLDRLGGFIDINSKPEKGTIIRIKLPLTLAIIQSLLISSKKERYAIPQANVVELMRVPQSLFKDKIDNVGGARVVRLRDKLIPLVTLSSILGMESKDSPLPDSYIKTGINIVIVSTGVIKYGIIVDDIHDSEEIVIKPLGRHLKKCRGYSGATILGNGRVALILDVGTLSQMAELTSIPASEHSIEMNDEKNPGDALEKQTFLIFKNSQTAHFAVPLELVERIEKVQCRDIEFIGGQRIYQSRGAGIPLFDIGEVAHVETFKPEKEALVIIFFVAGKDVGILAVPPIDSVRAVCSIDETTLRQPGIMGSVIINSKTMLIVDVIDLIEHLHPEWFSVKKKTKYADDVKKMILLAEDSKFFRNQIKCAIENEGYYVVEAEDGLAGMDYLNANGENISLVVTDLEMPNLDGFEFAKQIRQDKRFSKLPVIAVSSLAGKDDIEYAKICGVDEYQIKLNREKLIECIHNYLR
ncbi:Two compoment system response regulator/histidine kinase, CheA-like [Desulfonema limicola]|uniref:histidine kinase n=1 Tax=Desulfonema limicola TaxID=45656 RepID=A0A975B9S0_9BACT|nr:chemotaxis protein CheW [Desulfonema limicola]QTA81185.1 Two compoment system response regulator/histidine kinase, CheA-like [Desulfonema limicola]